MKSGLIDLRVERKHWTPLYELILPELQYLHESIEAFRQQLVQIEKKLQGKSDR